MSNRVHRNRSSQDAQIIMVFALAMALFLSGLIALVIDVSYLYQWSNRAQAAAQLAAQGGANDIDPNFLYADSYASAGATSFTASTAADPSANWSTNQWTPTGYAYYVNANGDSALITGSPPPPPGLDPKKNVIVAPWSKGTPPADGTPFTISLAPINRNDHPAPATEKSPPCPDSPQPNPNTTCRPDYEYACEQAGEKAMGFAGESPTNYIQCTINNNGTCITAAVYATLHLPVTPFGTTAVVRQSFVAAPVIGAVTPSTTQPTTTC